MSIIRKLNILGRAVNEKYPYLNCGGCCVYAALVAEALLLHKISCKGIVASWSAECGVLNLDEVRPFVKRNTVHEWQDNGISFSHVGLEFEYKGMMKHYDSNGVNRKTKKLDFMPIYPGRLNIVELQKLSSRKTGWNASFNRRDIPKIRKMIREYLAVDSSK